MPRPESALLDESSGAPQPSELLACSTCRSRKLKCDRLRPACTRCAKAKSECTYPASRRKPAAKRKNARELESRLAKLEGMLKGVSTVGSVGSTSKTAENVIDVDSQGGSSSSAAQEMETMWFGGEFDLDESFVTNLLNGDVPPVGPPPQQTPPSISADDSPGGFESFPTGEMVGLGQFETLPPFALIEELHNIFFQKQHSFIPIIHQGRYIRAFHSAPHMRPPMCLQYAIWAMAANGHEEYGSYSDIFYQRTRRYLQDDELKGFGEHSLTVAHAQAWALTATLEARCMFFTRAGLSSARCVKLIHMMGLHRLDDVPDEQKLVAPLLPPSQSWVELEERRRCFWGGFCIDSHASISTGWPTLINIDEVTTLLPSSEEAFNVGREEKSPTLQEALKGADYSTFAGASVICHIFNKIMKHIHRPTPNDRADDVNNGTFWKRHRELDNDLSSIFMFLPERFRLPKNLRDPVAVHTNLNLHAAVICLHNAACDKVDTFKLPAHLKKMSQDRSLTAAQEITNITKLTSHIMTSYKSPLVSLSLYCAASTYIYQEKDTRGSCDMGNLEFLVNCMLAISREHVITRAFLQQALLDIEINGITTSLKIPPRDKMPNNTSFNSIPLLARSSVSRRPGVPPPPPCSLRGPPLQHNGRNRWPFPSWSTTSSSSADREEGTSPDSAQATPTTTATTTAPPTKRRRRSPGPTAPPAPSLTTKAPTNTTTTTTTHGPSVWGAPTSTAASFATLAHRGSAARTGSSSSSSTALPRTAPPGCGVLPPMPAAPGGGNVAQHQPQEQEQQMPDLSMFPDIGGQWSLDDLGFDDGAGGEAWAFLVDEGGGGGGGGGTWGGEAGAG